MVALKTPIQKIYCMRDIGFFSQVQSQIYNQFVQMACRHRRTSPRQAT